jgi:hypothetical protein
MSVDRSPRQAPLCFDNREPIRLEFFARCASVSQLLAFEHEPSNVFDEAGHRFARVR